MRQLLAALALCALATGWAAPASANCDAALQFVANVGSEVTTAVADASMSDDQRLEEFRRIFRTNADFATMGKVSLGRYWNKLPESRYAEFFDLVERMIVQTMLVRLNESAGEQYQIQTDSCTVRSADGTQFYVDGPVLDSAGSKVTDVRWWVIRKSTGELKVLDITIAGVSLLIQKRDEFDYFITDNTRRVEPLLDELRARYGS